MKKKKSIYVLVILNIIGLIIIGISFCFNLMSKEAETKSEKHLFPIALKNDKWTYIDAKGKIAIRKQFDYAGFFSQGLAAVVVDDKCGYIDQKGRFVIKPQFDTAWEFKCGRAAIRKGKKWGFVDAKGRLIIKPQYDGAESFSNDLASVSINEGRYKEKTMFIDKNGKVKINSDDRKYKKMQLGDSFSEGLLPVEINNKWGFINLKGQVVIEPKYDEVKSFSDGLASVCIKYKWGFINKKGNLVIKPRYWTASCFSEGFSVVCLDYDTDEINSIKDDINGILGFNGFKSDWIRIINKSGDNVYKISGYGLYNNYPRFSNGLICINSCAINNKVQAEYVDKKGKVIFEFKYKYNLKMICKLNRYRN